MPHGAIFGFFQIRPTHCPPEHETNDEAQYHSLNEAGANVPAHGVLLKEAQRPERWNAELSGYPDVEKPRCSAR